MPLQPQYPCLQDWVEGYLCVIFVRRKQFRWCAKWWRHGEALVRLEALWRTWEQLHHEPVTGIATWLRDHLDPQLRELTSDAGTFSDCSSTAHSPPDPDRLPSRPAPPDWWTTSIAEPSVNQPAPAFPTAVRRPH